MSYILEALKKAQAERQLGDAPTIHAPQAAQAAPAGTTARKPLLLGLGAGALVVAAGVLLFWRAGPAPAPVAAPATTATPSAPAAPVAKAPPPASATLDVSAPPAPPAAPSAAQSAAPSAAPVSAPAAPTQAPAAPAATRTVPPAPPPAVAQPAPRAAAPAPTPVSAPEDSLPFLQQLPEPLRSEVPRVAFGGYMYSANPADRLLIVDKVLRREGEEVAPGLVLEKLLPKTAVMNYRGTRYRVPY